MNILRLLLIVGILLHPFCRHCFSEIQMAAKGYVSEIMPENRPIPSLGSADNEVPNEAPKTGYCTKTPLQMKAKFQCKLSLTLGKCEILPSSSFGSNLCHTPLPQDNIEVSSPLYLSFGVLLI